MTKYTIPLLEWSVEEYLDITEYRASTPFGDWVVVHYDNGAVLWFAIVKGAQTPLERPDTLKAAKAAAQEHWESRLKDCLTQEGH